MTTLSNTICSVARVTACACPLLLCSCATADLGKQWPGKPAEEIQQSLGNDCWDCRETEGRHYLEYTRKGAYTEQESYYESEYDPKTKSNKLKEKTRYVTKYENCTMVLELDENGKITSSHFTRGGREACIDAFPSRYKTIWPGQSGWWQNL